VRSVPSHSLFPWLAKDFHIDYAKVERARIVTTLHGRYALVLTDDKCTGLATERSDGKTLYRDHLEAITVYARTMFPNAEIIGP